MCDLEDIPLRIADHGSPIAIRGVERRLYGSGACGDSSLINAIGVLHVHIKKRWEQFPLIGRRDHDKRVADVHFGWAIGVNLAGRTEDIAKELGR